MRVTVLCRLCYAVGHDDESGCMPVGYGRDGPWLLPGVCCCVLLPADHCVQLSNSLSRFHVYVGAHELDPAIGWAQACAVIPATWRPCVRLPHLLAAAAATTFTGPAIPPTQQQQPPHSLALRSHPRSSSSHHNVSLIYIRSFSPRA